MILYSPCQCRILFTDHLCWIYFQARTATVWTTAKIWKKTITFPRISKHCHSFRTKVKCLCTFSNLMKFTPDPVFSFWQLKMSSCVKMYEPWYYANVYTCSINYYCSFWFSLELLGFLLHRINNCTCQHYSTYPYGWGRFSTLDCDHRWSQRLSWVVPPCTGLYGAGRK